MLQLLSFFPELFCFYFCLKNRNEAAAAASAAAPLGPPASPANAASQPSQRASQPARTLVISHRVASLPRSPHDHVALATPLASLWLQRTRLSPFRLAHAGHAHGHGRVDAVLHPSP